MANKPHNFSQKKYPLKKLFFGGILSIMFGVTIYFANNRIKEYQSLSTSAAAGNAEIFFEPNTANVSSPTTINLWVTTDAQTGFFAAEVTFDPTSVKVTSEPKLVDPNLRRVIKQTTMSEANTTGKLSLVIGIEPSNLTTAPTGTFKLASLSFAPISTTSKTTTLSISYSQVVDLGAIPFTVTSKTATLSLNPQLSTPTPSSSFTPKPSVTTTPTLAPSSVSNSDLSGPSLILTSGKNWWGYWVKAKASDVSKVSSITIAKNGDYVKKCTSTTTCKYYASKNSHLPFTIQVTATDRSSNNNKSYRSITIQ